MILSTLRNEALDEEEQTYILDNIRKEKSIDNN